VTRGDEHHIADTVEAARNFRNGTDISFETWVADEASG
jgi:hypothetical protein